MTLALRPATESDLESMMVIGHEAIRPYVEAVRGWDQQREEQGFREHFTPATIAIIEAHGSDAGYIKVNEHPDHLWLEGIYLSATCRGEGVGSEVIRGVLRRAEGVRKPVRLRVFLANPARSLYTRLGFLVYRETDEHLYMVFETSK